MMTVHIVLAMLLALAVVCGLIFVYKGYQAWRVGQQLAEELNTIVFEAITEASLSRDDMTAPPQKNKTAEDYLADIQTPAMLTTLLTALVKKCGSITVDLNDFLAIEEEDYISIYVNKTTQSLILSMDHNLEEKAKEATAEPYIMGNFRESDDPTYH